MLYGASVYWLDYNPLSRLICYVKTTHVNCSQVFQVADKIIQKANNIINAPNIIQFKNKDFWFQKPVQEALEILRELILEVEDNLQPLLWLAFSLTVRKTSDMTESVQEIQEH